MPQLLNQTTDQHDLDPVTFNNYSQNDFNSLRVSILREHSYDSKDAKEGPIFEDSVMSRDTTPGPHDNSFSVGQAASALRVTNPTPDSPKNILSYQQLKEQIEVKKERLMRMQNSFIQKNKRLVS